VVVVTSSIRAVLRIRIHAVDESRTAVALVCTGPSAPERFVALLVALDADAPECQIHEVPIPAIRDALSHIRPRIFLGSTIIIIIIVIVIVIVIIITITRTRRRRRCWWIDSV
jgi:ABC-type uncharacterized transport system permease subunit